MKESGFFRRLADKKIGRREFLKGSAALTAAAALGGCASRENVITRAHTRPALTDGKWLGAACWHNCGGRCLNQAYVVDGIPIRVKTDDSGSDTPNSQQQRSCVRGRSQRYHVLGSDRLKYPMKRKNWAPRGGGNKSLRGRDEWERISWDEAIAYIVDELNHARTNYGNRSIVGHGSAFMVSPEWGGMTTINDTASWGSFVFTNMFIGIPGNGFGGANCRMDLRKSETIVLVGSNPVASSLGNPPWNFWQAKEAGAKFIYVGPTYNYSADVYNAKWIPCRPAQDVTLFLAVAYVMITEDDPVNNPIIDWDFLHRCTVGFDADHMPADARLNENFKDYVLGRYDGQPKTPEWAAEFCGTPPDDIRYLARELRKDKKVALLHGNASARSNDMEDFPQIMVTIGAMGGHMGKPGHATGGAVHNNSSNGGGLAPALAAAGGVATGPAGPSVWVPPINAAQESIMAPELWDAILTGRYKRTDTFRTLGINSIDLNRPIDLRVLWQAGNHNILGTIVGAAKGIEAYRKLDFVCARALSLNASAEYADIVLPLSSRWERPGGTIGSTRGEGIFLLEQVIERFYECKSDFEMDKMITSALLGPQAAERIYPGNEGLLFLQSINACTVRSADNTRDEPLVRLSQADINEFTAKYGPTDIQPRAEGRISLEEFRRTKVYRTPRREGDNFDFVQYRAFRENPDANPLIRARPDAAGGGRWNPSGKIEIYSQTKADVMHAMGRSVIKPYPSYRPVLNGYEDSYSNWQTRTKGPYPYQLTNPHYAKRAHTNLDNVLVMREAFKDPFYINPRDAAEKGIQEGDTVLVYNQYARFLRPACLTERVMPGTVELNHGAWMDLDANGIDHGGSDCYIAAPAASGMAISGYNTQLVNFEKFTGPPLVPDYKRPLRVVNI